MPQQLDPARLSAALIELGVTPAALRAIQTAQPDKGRLMLAELRLVAKSKYRKLAKELHPDLNGGDPAKTAKFSFLSEVMKQVEGMEYRFSPAPPPPPPRPGPPVRPAPPPPQAPVYVVFNAPMIRPVVRTPFHRPGPKSTGSAPGPVKGPQGVHVVFIRPAG